MARRARNTRQVEPMAAKTSGWAELAEAWKISPKMGPSGARFAPSDALSAAGIRHVVADWPCFFTATGA